MSLLEDMLRIPVGTWCYYNYRGAANPSSPAKVIRYHDNGSFYLYFPGYPGLYTRNPMNYTPCPPPEGVTVAPPGEEAP